MTLTHEDGSSITLALVNDKLSVSMRGPEAPASPAFLLSLSEVEALQKALAVMAAKVRGVKAKPNG